MPLCRYYALGKRVPPWAVPPWAVPQAALSPVGGPLTRKPKLPLSLFSIAYHFFLLFLSLFQAG